MRLCVCVWKIRELHMTTAEQRMKRAIERTIRGIFFVFFFIMLLFLLGRGDSMRTRRVETVQSLEVYGGGGREGKHTRDVIMDDNLFS